MSSQLNFTWQEVLIGSQHINQMKQEIDAILNILRKAVNIACDSSPVDKKNAKLIRFDLSDHMSRCQLHFSAPDYDNGGKITVVIIHYDEIGVPSGDQTKNLGASQLPASAVPIVHAAMTELIQRIVETYPNTKYALEFLAQQAAA